MKVKTMLLIMLVVGLLIIISCDKTTETKNNPPIIIGISASPSDLDWGATSQLVVIAEDPEEQILAYSWTTTWGEFITPTTNDTVTWQAPDSSGSFVCTVTVSDGEKTVSKNITITVTEHPVLSIYQDSLVFGATTEILNFTVTNIGTGVLIWSINTTTDDGGAWIISVTPSNGSTMTSEQIAMEVDRSGLENGAYYGWAKVTSNDGSDSLRISMDVIPQPYDFFDDFSQGDGNWTFGGCTHYITNEELTMVSNTYYQANARSFTFSTYLDVPWIFKGDMTIVSSSSEETYNGISVHINDIDPFAVEYMWLAVIENSSSIYNWVWLWWIPSLADEWLPWDENCLGYSSYVYSNNQKNTLEMSVSSSEIFTLKANNHTLSSNNNAVNDMEYMAGINITLKVIYVELLGGTETTTKWDNIIFDSETSQLNKVQGIKFPMPPSDEYVNEILNRITQGEDVTLKSLLKKKLNK